MSKINRFTLFFLVCVIPSLAAASTPASKDHISLTPEEQAWIDHGHTVRVRLGNWPPFMFTRNGFKGIAVDYIQQILSGHGIAFEFVSDTWVPWAQAFDYIRDRKAIDMVLAAKITEERKKSALFTDDYLFLPWVIFSRIDSGYIGGLADLEGKTVCAPKGFIMHDLLKANYPGIQLLEITGKDLAPRCIETLAQGKTDAYVGNLAVGSYIIQTRGFTNLKVAAPTPFGTHNQAMAVRSDWPELVSIINKSLAAFTPEQHAGIRNRWLSVRYDHGIRPIDIFKWVAGVAGVLVIILLVILFWNRSLNREIFERKKIEARLKDSENRYRNLSDASFEGILITDRGRILEANAAMSGMFGYDSFEFAGMDASALAASNDGRHALSTMASVYETPYKTTGMKKNGTAFPMEIRSKMFSYRSRDVRVTSIRDLTLQAKAEEEIKALRGILPTCSFCKKIRDDNGSWEPVDQYIDKHSEADVSHSICPDCLDEHYPSLSDPDSPLEE